jgi:hypothetical protein
MSIVLISPPAVEPVTLNDVKVQLGLAPNEDTDHVKSDLLAQQLRRLMMVARAACEDYTRRAFITQTWQLLRDGWPRTPLDYDRMGYPSIVLPKPPFQSITAFTYVDTEGNLQNVLAPVLGSGQTQPGSNIPTNFTAPLWTCQIDAGSETQPARLIPPFATPWPPVQRVPNNVAITFICGYGATGASVPVQLAQAILFLTQFYYENGAVTDLAIPRVVERLLDPYVNRVA